jgi:alkaline phosphatase D
VRLGVVSCSSYAAGPFAVYRHLAEADVDLVLHLGDYLYDRSSGPRPHDPPEPPTTLADYRRRHAQQRSDPDLQRLHASVAIAAVWDDHDVAGNAWRGGADDHDPAEDGDWEVRRAAGIRAWLEWLPVRLPDPARPERIWRQLPYGVADLLLLDTRHDGRDQQLTLADGDEASLADPDRSLVSDDQRRWLLESLAASTAPWRVLGNQVVLTPLGIEVPEPLAGASGDLGLTIGGSVINPDAWDGYPVERSRLLEAVAAAGPTFVLTGDVHSSWAFEVPGADGEPVTVEWVTPSVTATPFASIVRLPTPSLSGGVVDLVAEQLPQVRWAEITEHGYVVVAVTEDRAQADWWHVDLDSGERSHAASWSVPSGSATLEEATPLAARTDEPAAGVPPGAPPPAGPVAVGDDDDDRALGGPLAGLGVAGAAIAAVVAVRRRNRRRG